VILILVAALAAGYYTGHEVGERDAVAVAAPASSASLPAAPPSAGPPLSTLGSPAPPPAALVTTPPGPAMPASEGPQPSVVVRAKYAKASVAEAGEVELMPRRQQLAYQHPDAAFCRRAEWRSARRCALGPRSAQPR